MSTKYAVGGVSVSIDGRAVVELPPRGFRGRLTGELFENDKAFLLPGAVVGMRGMVQFHKDHGGAPAVLVAHTGGGATATAEVALSCDRATAAAGFLRNDADAWLAFYRRPAGSLAWGTREDQHMLSAVRDDDGVLWPWAPSGQADEVMQEALRRFQKLAGLPQSGRADDATRRALVTRYLDRPGTALPAGARLDLHGCGANHPDAIDAGPDDPRNRSVELFMFEAQAAQPAPRPCGSGCTEHAVWVQRTVETVDLVHEAPDYLDAFLEIELVDEAGQPVPGVVYEIHTPDGGVREGNLDDRGRARVAPIPPGLCRVRFPELDSGAWQRA